MCFGIGRCEEPLSIKNPTPSKEWQEFPSCGGPANAHIQGTIWHIWGDGIDCESQAFARNADLRCVKCCEKCEHKRHAH